MPGKKASTEFSCVVCTQRKVRCDKDKPCKNCVKAGIECEVAPPPPPRRRKRKLDERELVRKLAKYEELLEKNGVDFRAVDNDDFGSLDSDADAEHPSQHSEAGSHHAALRTQGSQSDYYHKEFENASHLLFGHSTENTRQSFHRAFDTVFDSSSTFPFAMGISANIKLINMHPPAMQVMQLWQVYLNNVDPLLKLTHTPTLQKRVIEACGKISSGLSVDEELEALLFSIYFISVNSLTEAETLASFGTPKSSLQARYHVASQQALLNVNLMRTLDLTVLQAYVLHLISIRSFMDPRTHYVLIGIAVRIATRLGVHREATQLRISPFEIEQRRRLWWNLVALDKRIAETTGATVTAMSTSRADCKRPLNINDSDLHFYATHPLQASSAPTEMVCCLARFELATAASPDAIHPLPTLSAAESRNRLNYRRPWETEDRNDGHQRPLIALQEYAEYVETTHIKRLDPSIPLHLFTVMITRQSLRKLQLIANMGDVLKNRSAASPELRQWAWDVSIRLLEDDNTMQSTPSLQGWLWYTHMYFPFPAYMFLVHELKQTCTGEACSRAWEAMDNNHKLRGLMGPGRKPSPMHIAFGKHFLEAWDARLRAEGERGRMLQTPELVTMIQGVLQSSQRQESPHKSGQPQTQVSTGSMFAGITPQGSQINQGWYGASGLDDFDFFAGLGDMRGFDDIIPSLI